MFAKLFLISLLLAFGWVQAVQQLPETTAEPITETTTVPEQIIPSNDASALNSTSQLTALDDGLALNSNGSIVPESTTPLPETTPNPTTTTTTTTSTTAIKPHKKEAHPEAVPDSPPKRQTEATPEPKSTPTLPEPVQPTFGYPYPGYRQPYAPHPQRPLPDVYPHYPQHFHGFGPYTHHHHHHPYYHDFESDESDSSPPKSDEKSSEDKPKPKDDSMKPMYPSYGFPPVYQRPLTYPVYPVPVQRGYGSPYGYGRFSY